MAYESQGTINYFSAYQDYFWRWADGGQVIEFANEKTICYREDLTGLLKELPKTTSFSLGTILLMLSACKDDWENVFNAKEVLINLMPFDCEDRDVQEGAEFNLKGEAYGFLSLINQLPKTYRSELNRVSLLQSVFDALNVKGYHMGLLPILREFNSGEMDEEIFNHSKPFNQKQLIQDLAPLASAYSIFKSAESLENKIRTGLNAAPMPVELLDPEPGYKDLLDELEKDEKTYPVSKLARSVIASLNIPMYLSGQSEQPLGGISDLSNKGSYDKLLLSELAQDDALLTARLANNEALYLKREASPEQKPQQLGILIDSTLKTWGSARVLAIAAALAFNESKLPNQHLKVFSLGGKHMSAQSLVQKADAISLLEKMDPALHCGQSLAMVMQDFAEKLGQYVFITTPYFLKDPVSAAYYSKIRHQLKYLVTVSGEGNISLNQLNKRESKLIREVHIDVNELLLKPRKIKQDIIQSGLPAIFQQSPFPLYFPTSKIRLQENSIYQLQNKKVLAVSIDQRLLYWSNEKSGAIELLGSVVKGKYCFGEFGETAFLMIIPEEKKAPVKVCTLNLVDCEAAVSEIKVSHHSVREFIFISPFFHFRAANGITTINPQNNIVMPVHDPNSKIFENHKTLSPTARTQIKRQINNGYSVINSSKKIFICAKGKLFSDRKEFVLIKEDFFWQENRATQAEWRRAIPQQNLTIDHLPQLSFNKFVWRGGNSAIVDSRGLLHLKSSDPAIPEVCIVMIIDRPTACWSSDGYVSGAKYFTGDFTSRQLKPSEFYSRYIQPFIDQLQ